MDASSNVIADIGKLMNGYGLSNYDVKPKGWDWADILVRISTRINA